MTAFDKALAETLKREGEYSNRPGDPGGETFSGVSRRRWPEWKGWSLVDAHKRNPEFPAPLYEDPDLARLVREFYLTNFWNPLRCDEFDAATAAKLFDVAVNQGASAAIRVLQVALVIAGHGIDPDGKLGPQTIAAAAAADKERLGPLWSAAQAGYYACLVVKVNPKLEENLRTEDGRPGGWLNRARA